MQCDGKGNANAKTGVTTIALLVLRTGELKMSAAGVIATLRIEPTDDHQMVLLSLSLSHSLSLSFFLTYLQIKLFGNQLF